MRKYLYILYDAIENCLKNEEIKIAILKLNFILNRINYSQHNFYNERILRT